ncbi:Beta-galactosidase [Limihaloglobus sulfuriphilus]|uniref:Beta-galactosidase n=1 Tax=Limihaloglobus sulfuriphilus TaxID=1851148 RepID=A0A1Q2MAV9_9BACT|nr:glycoside hydrolase family 2 TIM barrel-domain containing protein [Limihaloglobus sulfuriphilus]AQQ69800.1 Beta-galactosidase [Limihaloglobus sulfuriphilus]
MNTIIKVRALLLLAVFAVSFSYAETVTENFSSDPETRGWTNQSAGSTVFEYMGGFLQAKIHRDSSNTARYYIPLGAAYDKSQEFWFEMDWQILDTSNSGFQRGLFGVFNSGTSDNHHNMIGDVFAYRDYNGSPRGNRHDAVAYASDGTKKTIACAPDSPGIPYGAMVRVIGHYDGDSRAEVAIYNINPDGSTGSSVMSTALLTVIDSTDNVTFDTLAIANRTDGSYDSSYHVVRIDNIYFSTESANTSHSLPDFPLIEANINEVTVATGMDSLKVTANITQDGSQSTSFYVRQTVFAGEDGSGGELCSFTSPAVTFSSNQTRDVVVESNDLTPDPALWSPQEPNLNFLRTEVLDSTQSTILATEDTVIGFRSFEVVGDKFYLNGSPIYLFGYQWTSAGRVLESISQDPAFIAQHVARLKSMNVNFVRLSDPPSAPGWLEEFDRAGIMVFTGSYYGAGVSSPDLAQSCFDSFESRMKVSKNHASVVMWVIGNEWNLDDPVVFNQVAGHYSNCQSLDDTRPMFITWTGKYYNGSGDPVPQIGSDFLSHHSYSGWYGGWAENFYPRYADVDYPQIVTEAMGVYTNRAEGENGGFRVDEDKYLTNVLRVIGHSYNYSQDSLDYQAELCGDISEILRRKRGLESSFCGAFVFTDGYYYNPSNYYASGDATTAESPKPVIDVVRNVYSPVNVSIENLNPKIFAGDILDINCHVMNDDPSVDILSSTALTVDLLDRAGQSMWSGSYDIADIPYYSTVIQAVDIATDNLVTGDYFIYARLSDGQNDLCESLKNVFIANQNWADVENVNDSIAVYDVSGDTVAVLSSLGFSTTPISNFTNISGYDLVVIGKTSLDSTAAGSEAEIFAYINAGGRVLVLEQNTVDTRNNLNGWLGTSITTGAGGENFVNIERPEIKSLMDGLDRPDFRRWNNISTPDSPDSRLFLSYFNLQYSDLDKCAVLANAGQSLFKSVLVEIYPYGSSGGSCLLNSVYSVSRSDSNPVAGKYLANLVSYMLDDTSYHSQYAAIGAEVEFADFQTEKGIFFAPLIQGMIVEDSGDYYYRPQGRRMRGMQVLSNSVGYLEDADSLTSWTCPLYFKSIYDIEEIVFDAANPQSQSLSYTLTVNSQQQSTVTVPAGQRVVETFDISDIPSGTDVKLEIESDKGLVFYSLKLADPLPADLNTDGIVDYSDFFELAENWNKSLADIWPY